jgi:uncharacterized protein DUF6544
MLQLLFWLLVTFVGVAGTWVSAQSLRFTRLLSADVRALLARAAPAAPALERLEQLPPPVRVYLRRALGSAPGAVRGVRFRHGGRFRTALDGPWQEIRGEQYDTLDPPGFIWWGRLSPLPGVWIDARDRGIEGKGSMRVSVESSVTLFDRSGPELDQGAMLRLLSDLVLIPGVLLDARYVTWTPIDERRAAATLSAPGITVTGTFEFGADGLPQSFSAERYFDAGHGEAQLLPWSGDYADYRSASGLLVPHRFIGYWHVEGRRVPYVDFELETPQYDPPGPF